VVWGGGGGGVCVGGGRGFCGGGFFFVVFGGGTWSELSNTTQCESEGLVVAGWLAVGKSMERDAHHQSKKPLTSGGGRKVMIIQPKKNVFSRKEKGDFGNLLNLRDYGGKRDGPEKGGKSDFIESMGVSNRGGGEASSGKRQA